MSCQMYVIFFFFYFFTVEPSRHFRKTPIPGSMQRNALV
jgi:hypothetical protein